MRRRPHSGGVKPKVKTQLPRGGACSHSAAQLPVWLAADSRSACGLTCAAVAAASPRALPPPWAVYPSGDLLLCAAACSGGGVRGLRLAGCQVRCLAFTASGKSVAIVICKRLCAHQVTAILSIWKTLHTEPARSQHSLQAWHVLSNQIEKPVQQHLLADARCDT
jgi:hypothetical protein